MTYTETHGKKISKMSLGTVQLGMDYGIANRDGKPSEESSSRLLCAALEGGITSIDTARAYGDSEAVIGRFFAGYNGALPAVTTKIKHIEAGSPREIEAEMIGSVETSLSLLGIQKADVLMLHSAPDMNSHGSAVPSTLEKIRKMGYADIVGVSVYLPREVDELLENPVYQAVQIPMNILDFRLRRGGQLKKLKERGILTFVRSVFLQGVFFLDPEKIADEELKAVAYRPLKRLAEIAADAGMSVGELAVCYIRDLPEVTSLVLGAEKEEQVRENLTYFDLPPLSDALLERIGREFSDVDIERLMAAMIAASKR